jgi:hypothetical protein
MWREWWTDRQTDMTKLTVAFRGFTNGPENGHYATFSETHPKPGHNNVTKDYTVLYLKIIIE